MRAFHLSWFAFFLCFFGWFGIAPLMIIVREEFQLSKEQVGNIIIASVSVTFFARLLVGWLCDRVGPRKAYAYLLMFGSIPVAGIGLSTDYESFLLFRLAIGAVGGAFVITQYHTSVMFAPSIVGTANATTAGWGNLGGGVTQIVMPLVCSLFIGLGVGEYWGWRLAMVVPGVLMFLTAIAYLRLTQDTPEGNFRELRIQGKLEAPGRESSFLAAASDHRVWALFLIYGACFGVELTINNVAAFYFYDSFQLSITSAGLIAGLFGLMNIFARTLGGYFGDRAGRRFGLQGRVALLGGLLLLEGAALIIFSQMAVLGFAIVSLIFFSISVQMAEGATFSVVPFLNDKALGSVSGIVGAGGNAGAVAAGFLFRAEGLSTSTALLILGIAVASSSLMTLLIRFGVENEVVHSGQGTTPLVEVVGGSC